MIDVRPEFISRAKYVKGSRIEYGTIARDETCCNSTASEGSGLFQVGSVTKVFTATMLAQVVMRNVVSLETRLGEFYEGLNSAVAAIQLKDLASHHSGLPRLPRNLDAASADPYANYSRDAMLQALRGITQYEMLESKGLVEYSNFGYAVLGDVIAQAYRMTYADAIDSLILQPLEMKSSFLATEQKMRSMGNTLDGATVDGQTAQAWSFDAFAPAGALVSTIGDLLRFAYAALRPRCDIGMAIRSCLDRGDEIGANGPIAWVPAADSVYWHNGQTAGSHAMLAVRLDTSEAVAAVWNAAASLDDICLYALGALSDAEVYPGEAHVDASVLARYVGSYNGLRGRFDLTLDDDRLVLKGRGYGEYPLYALDERRFFSKKVAATYEFPGDAPHLGVLETWGKWPKRFAAKLDVTASGEGSG